MKRNLLLLPLLLILCCISLVACGDDDCTEHSWDEGTVSYDGGCDQETILTYCCTACGETKEDRTAAPGHNFVYDRTEEPGCTTSGAKYYVCASCGDTSSESIDPTGHSLPEEYTSDFSRHWLVCNTCQSQIGAEMHDFDNGYCKCSESVLNYTAIVKNNETVGYSLTGIRDGNYISLFSELTVPDTYRGLPVLEVEMGYWSDTTKLTKVTLGKNVERIGSSAFSNFTSLKTVAGGGSLKVIETSAFADCSALESFAYGTALTYIGDNAFYNCTSLSSIEIPAGVTYIGNYAFYDCGKVETIVYNAVDAEFFFEYGYPYTSNPFKGVGAAKAQVNVTIGEGVQVIPVRLLYSVFRPVVEMKSTALKTIGGEAFNNYNLRFKSFSLPATLEVIDYSAFQGARIESVVIPSGVSRIENSAFRDCELLKSVEIGTGVSYIGPGAFNNCTALEELLVLGSLSEMRAEIDDNYGGTEYNDSQIFNNAGTKGKGIAVTFGPAVEKVPSLLFYSVSIYDLSVNLKSVTFAENSVCKKIGRGAFTECRGLESIVLPASLESIGNSAFSATSICSVVIPDSVTVLGTYVFDSCRGLSLVTIGSGLKALPKSTFQSCVMLSYIVVPDGITAIGEQCFYNTGLRYVEIGAGVEEVGSYAFSGTELEVYNRSSFDYLARHNEEKDVSKFPAPEMLLSASDSSIILIKGFLVETAIGSRVVGYCGGSNALVLPTKAELAPYGISGLTIAEKAFYYCDVRSLVITDAVSAIGEKAFNYTISLGKVTFDGTLYLSIGASAFESSSVNALEFKNGATLSQINERAFMGAKLKNVKIPGSVSVYESAFAGNLELTSVEFETLARVRGYVFENCVSLESVKLPSSVNGIGERAFAGCCSLKSFTIPKGLATANLSPLAFEGCTSLESFEVEQGATNYRVVDGVLYDWSYGCNLVMYPAGKKAATFEMPDTVTTIHSYAFLGAVYLQTVIFSEGVTSIPAYAFEDAYGLSLLVLSDNVQSIADYAFAGCNNLYRIYLGENISSIGANAFSYNVYSRLEIYNPSGRDFSHLGLDVRNDVTAPSAYTKQGDYLFKTVSGTHYLIAYLGASDTLSLPADFGGESYEIGVNAFVGLPIRAVSIPMGVTGFGVGAFATCHFLERVEITTAVTSVDASAGVFYEAGIYGNGIHVVFTDESVTVPAYLFRNCSTNIKTVTIGEGVRSLGHAAFEDCNEIETVYYNAVSASRGSSTSYIFDRCYSKDVTFVVGDAVEYLCSGLLKSDPSSKISFNVGTLIIGSETALGSIRYDLTDHVFDIYFYAAEERFAEIFESLTVSSITDEPFFDCTVYFMTEE